MNKNRFTHNFKIPPITDYIKITSPKYIPLGIAGLSAGIAASGGVFNISSLLAIISIVTLVSGLNTFNSIFDLEIDRINKPHRPLPSGKITPKAAIIYSGTLFAVGFFSAIFLTTEFLMIYSISVIISLLYSLPKICLKKRFVLNGLTMAIVNGFLYPLAGWSLNPLNPIPTYFLGFLLLLGVSLSVTKDFEDIKGDKMYSAKTFPTIIGIKNTVIFILSMLLISLFFLAGLIFLNLVADLFLLIFAVYPILFYANYRFYSKTKNSNKIDKKHLFRVNYSSIVSLVILIESIVVVSSFI